MQRPSRDAQESCPITKALIRYSVTISAHWQMVCSFCLLLGLIGASADPALARSRPSLPNDYKVMQAMQVQIVRNAQAGCEPDCAEWISAEGDIVEQTPDDFRRVLKAMGNRNLPVFVNSGGGSIEAAIIIGNLRRQRQMDVAVTRTDFETCVGNTKACRGAGKPIRGLPNSYDAYCASACTLVLAAGTQRFVSPWSLVGVHQIVVYQTQIRIRRTYRVTTLQRPDGGTRTHRKLISEQRSAGKINCELTASRPEAERSALPPAKTAHDWTIESILHSSLVAEPSGVPSSK